MDAVNQPRHYKKDASLLETTIRAALTNNGDIDPLNLECIEAMVSMLTIDEIRGYLRGNSFKYRWRYTHKNGIQDLKKAKWYEKKLLRFEKVMSNHLNKDVK